VSARSPEAPSRGKRFARLLGASYLIGLVLAILAMRFVGERFWVTTILLYLPRIGFALPLPFVVGAYLVTGEKLRALVVFVVATLLVTLPLMGYQPSGRSESAPGAIRLMSWNTYFGRIDNDAILRLIVEQKPDVFLGQATAHRTRELLRAQLPGYAFDGTEEFFICSRWPITDKLVPPDLAEDPAHRAQFVRWTVETPGGPVDFFSMHPRSPRTGLERFRGMGMRTRLIQGDLAEDPEPINTNTLLRQRQVEAVMAEVGRSKHPVVVAGDTNLPTLSSLYHRTLGRLNDGFDAAGHGLGYTFPAKRPWMRIDRILTDDRFRFLSFTTGTVVASDHHYVVAELARK
jgi:endonuclease/exonuclease/phosphatase (EEP) superfamily protein YafD